MIMLTTPRTQKFPATAVFPMIVADQKVTETDERVIYLETRSLLEILGIRAPGTPRSSEE